MTPRKTAPMPEMPPKPEYMTSEQKAELADSGVPFYILGCEWEDEEFTQFGHDRWNITVELDDDPEVDDVVMSLDDSPLRTKQFGAMRDLFEQGSEAVGPCVLTTVKRPGKGNPVFNILPAGSEPAE